MSKTMQEGSAIIKTIVLVVLALGVCGLVLDALNGFYILRNAQSVAMGVGGLFLAAILYGIGELGADRISSRDETSDPLCKRVFHLFCLLVFIGAFTAAAIFIFIKFSGG